MDWLSNVLLLAVAVLIGWGISVLFDIRTTLREISRQLSMRGVRHHSPSVLTNYSTWTYRDGKWSIVESRLEVGFTVGEPPRRPGAYEGETVRRPAVRQS